MRKIFLLWCAIIVGITSYVLLVFKHTPNLLHITSPLATKNPTPTSAPPLVASESLFIPYWTVTSLRQTHYSNYFYFGIEATPQGINTKEDGYVLLSQFARAFPMQQRLLVIRMVDSSQNQNILQDKTSQMAIINQSVTLAKEYDFAGLVLDFEYAALPFEDVVKSITTFSTLFASQTHASHLLFYQMLSGDTFYRARPFDASALAKNADKILVMAYDLHKVGGDAGPNFPLGGNDYTFSQMIQDFTAKVPKNKLVITFGMFGYDWKLNNKGLATGNADIYSLQQIQQKFLHGCPFTSCTKKREDGEPKITYLDDTQTSHVLWYEDMDSVHEKEKYLETQGIGDTAFWAYTYF